MAGKSRLKPNSRKTPLTTVRNFRALQFEPIPPDARASFFVRRCDETHLPFFWHYHPELEIDVYLEGEGIRFVGDSIENFQVGDLCLLGSNLPHSWTTVPSPRKRTRSIFIQFAPDCFGPDFLTTPEMRPIKELMVRARRGLRFHGHTHRIVRERLIAMAEGERGCWKQTCDLLWVLGTLAESKEYTSLATASLGPVQNSTANRRLMRVLDYMNAETDSIPAQQMAAHRARLSPAAFSRFFKRCIGKTYVQYRNELRIGRVCRQLLDTDDAITQIAMNAGFNNLSNFNEQFLSLKGVTPRAYRHQARQGLIAKRA
jgi:AraC-like DNA-binding protein